MGKYANIEEKLYDFHLRSAASTKFPFLAVNPIDCYLFFSEEYMYEK